MIDTAANLCLVCAMYAFYKVVNLYNQETVNTSLLFMYIIVSLFYVVLYSVMDGED